MTCAKCNKDAFVLFEAGLCRECFDQSGLKTAPVKDKPVKKEKSRKGLFRVRLSPEWYYAGIGKRPKHCHQSMAKVYQFLGYASRAAERFNGTVEELK